MSEIAPLSLNLSGLSRHGYAYTGVDGKLYLSLPERLPHEDDSDAVPYTCRGSEYLTDIANAYYAKLFRRPEDVAEVIAEFQEDPIVDLSIPPPQGRVLMLPSPDYIMAIAYGESLSEIPEM